MLLTISCPPVARKQHIKVFLCWEPSQDIFQPIPRVYLCGLAAGEEGVDDGRPDGGGVVAAEEIVPAALCWQYDYVGIEG